MMKKFKCLLKHLIMWFLDPYNYKFENEAEEKIKIEEVVFNVILSKQSFEQLDKEGCLTFKRTRNSNAKVMAKKYADFKRVKLNCHLQSNSSKKFIVATLVEIQKEKGNYFLKVEKD